MVTCAWGLTNQGLIQSNNPHSVLQFLPFHIRQRSNNQWPIQAQTIHTGLGLYNLQTQGLNQRNNQCEKKHCLKDKHKTVFCSVFVLSKHVSFLGIFFHFTHLTAISFGHDSYRHEQHIVHQLLPFLIRCLAPTAPPFL